MSHSLWATSSPLALVCALALPCQVIAQTAPVANSPAQDNRVVYDLSFFSRYSAATAEDMLRLIPGVPTILDNTTNQQERGFGSGGARILIDGRRFPGKANEITTNLRRITAESVLRVELISGTVEGISVRSEGILVNIVLKEGHGLTGAGNWQANAKFNDQGRGEYDGLISYNGVRGPISYTLGVERNVRSPYAMGNNRWSDRVRDEVYYGPDGAVQETRPQVWTRDVNKWSYTGSLTYDFWRGDRLQLNGLYETQDITQWDRARFQRYAAGGAPTEGGQDVHQLVNDHMQTVEFSGQYESAVGPGELAALVLVRRENNPSAEFRNLLFATRTVEVSRSLTQQEKGEDILRATYTLPIAPGQSLELGGEAARNTLDQTLRVFFDRDGDARVEEVTFPTSVGHVEEIRGEMFAVLRWSVTERLSAESALAYEVSSITNNFPFSPKRSLGFLKPRLDVRYRASDTVQYRLLVDRTVSQLDFLNFVPAYDFVDSEIDAGNPGIEPEKTWTIEVGYERRLVGDQGLLEARAFYKDITDAIDRVPLRDSRGNYYSARGNLPPTTLFGGEVKLSARLGRIGVPDALLSLRLLSQRSETRDPFTGEPRRLATDRGFNGEIGYRHDIRRWRLAYGFTYKESGYPGMATDLFLREQYWIGPSMDAFVERRLTASTSLRLDIQNIAADESKTREFYAVNVMDGRVQRVERYREKRDLRFALSLKGNF